MGLTSAMSTALTGMTSAETTIDVVGNNLANANTVGFKASEATFANQFLQTQSLGSAPTQSSGGTNPRQIGLGTLVASITPSFAQGTIQISSNPTDFAIQGDGFFIVRSLTGEIGYTRNGIFKLNSENQLITTIGDRLLGYGVNEQYEVQNSELVPITIPIGSKSAAEATENVTFEGTLSSFGEIANAAKIIQSETMYDGNYSAPDSPPTVATATGGPLSGTYSYYITYYDPVSGEESRPSAVIGPQTVDNGFVNFSDFPVPDVQPDDPGQWTRIRLYRNTNAESDQFYRVTELDIGAATTYTDDNSDTAISLNEKIDFIGPKISRNTALEKLVKSDGTYYFPQDGILHFTGNKGTQKLATKDLVVTAATTLGDFLDFVTQSMGVQSGNGIPDSVDTVHPSYPPIPPGSQILSDNRIQFTGNNGVDNALTINTTALQFQTDAGTQSIDLPFSTYQEAVGQSAATTNLVYDSLGIPCGVTFTAVLESRDGNATTYRWFADSSANAPPGGEPQIAVGTGLIQFDGNGNFIGATNDTISIYRGDYPSTSPLTCTLHFDQLSGLAEVQSAWNVKERDGSPPQSLVNFTVAENGTITGVFSQGTTRTLGQIRLTRFSNPAGLNQKGQNVFVQGVNSGLPMEGNPGERGIGSIIAGAVELSNADIGSNLIDLITASTMYRSNTRTISTAQQMIDELLSLRR